MPAQVDEARGEVQVRPVAGHPVQLDQRGLDLRVPVRPRPRRPGRSGAPAGRRSGGPPRPAARRVVPVRRRRAPPHGGLDQVAGAVHLVAEAQLGPLLVAVVDLVVGVEVAVRVLRLLEQRGHPSRNSRSSGRSAPRPAPRPPPRGSCRRRCRRTTCRRTSRRLTGDPAQVGQVARLGRAGRRSAAGSPRRCAPASRRAGRRRHDGVARERAQGGDGVGVGTTGPRCGWDVFAHGVSRRLYGNVVRFSHASAPALRHARNAAGAAGTARRTAPRR